jgi:hypothetical protein
MKRTAKVLAANAKRHLNTIRAASLKLAAEFGDVDAFFEKRAEDVITLANDIEDEINDWLPEQPEGSVL